MALIPVCIGSVTGCRCTTLGAWISSSRRWVSSIGPLPSSGVPSGSTTRPRKLSPTGTESTSPVRLTRWPSSILLNSPRMTTPISRTSRFSARPRVPSSNSSSSLAMHEGSPSTYAMPSPHSETIPISSVAVASGSYVSTKRSSASRISSGRIVSSAIVFASLFPGSLLVPTCSGGQPAPQPGEPTRHGAVDALPRDLDGHAADDLGVEHDVQVYVMAVRRRQGRRQPAALRGGERDRDVHFGHESLPSFGGQAGKLFQARIQRTSPGLQGRLCDQPHRRLGHLAAEQRVEQLTLALCREVGVRQGGAQLRLGAHHPAEPEQLILQLVKRPATTGLLDDRERRELLGRVGQVGGLGPALPHQGGNQLQRRVADLPAEQCRHQAGLALGRPGGVGQRPPLTGVGVAVEHLAEPLLGLGERRPAGPSHRVASASAALPDCSSSCSRNLSTVRRCLASVSSDSPTTRLASSTESVPISARSATRACCRSASICA